MTVRALTFAIVIAVSDVQVELVVVWCCLCLSFVASRGAMGVVIVFVDALVRSKVILCFAALEGLVKFESVLADDLHHFSSSSEI